MKDLKKEEAEAMDQIKRNEIVEKHMNALMDELRTNGDDTIGVAGGVVRIEEEADKSLCHAFFVMMPDIGVNGVPVDPKDFVIDVADKMKKAW